MEAFGGVNREIPKETEIALLKNQADYLNGELESIQARVHALEGQKTVDKSNNFE
jgi:hypothetical protein